MSTTAGFSTFDHSGIDIADTTIRHLVKTSNFPIERLVAIAIEAIASRPPSASVWALSGVLGEQAKPLIEARSGSSYSTEEAAHHLKVSDETVRNQHRREELISYPAIRGKGHRFPRWQFMADGDRLSTLPWVKPLITAYGHNGWGLVDFLTVPRDTENGLNYLAKLQSGASGVDDVILAAKRSNPS